MNSDTLSPVTFQAQFEHASKIQQKSQLVAFYLKNYIITKAVEFLKFERSQGKNISAMMEEVQTWFQDLEGLKQSLCYELQNEEGSKKQYYEFMVYQFSRCDAQYKSNTYSQQLADEFSSLILLTEAYSVFNVPEQQVEDMKNQAKVAYNKIIEAIQTDPRFQPKTLPTYSNFSKPSAPNTQVLYQGHELETPNPDYQPPSAISASKNIAQAKGNLSSSLSGFQAAESIFVPQASLDQKKELNNASKLNKTNQSITRPTAPQNNLSPSTALTSNLPVESVKMPQNSLNKLPGGSQDEELVKLDDLLASLKQGTGQSIQNLQSQHQTQRERVGASIYKVGQSNDLGDINQPAFSGFQMAESNYVPKNSIGQNFNAHASINQLQGIAGNFLQGNQSQVPRRLGMSQNYNQNLGNFNNNNTLPDFTKIGSQPNAGQNIIEGYNQGGNGGFGFPVIPGAKIEDSVVFNPHSDQPKLPGGKTSLPQNPVLNVERKAEDSKREVHVTQHPRIGGGPSSTSGPSLNLPNDKYDILKEMCRMTISELDYKNVKEAKENLRKALALIKQYNP